MVRPEPSFSRFLILWALQLLSRIGSGITAFALGVDLLQKTGSAAAYSLLLLCAFVPSVLLTPLGGVMADRYPRRTLMACGDAVSAVGIFLVIVSLLLRPGLQGPIFLGVALSSLGVALHAPAFKAAITDLLEPRAYAKASGLIQLAEASRYLLAPALAAFLLARFSLPQVLALDGLSFLLAALTALFIGPGTDIPRGQGHQGVFWADFAEGIRTLSDNRTVYRLLGLTTAVTFLTGILQALFVPVVLSLSDVSTLGSVQSLAASGMLVGSLWIVTLGESRNQLKILERSLLSAGFFYLLIGLSQDTMLITGTAFGFFLSLPFVNTSLEVLFRQNIENAMQGRLWSLIAFFSQAGMLSGVGAAGFLADHVFNPLMVDGGLLADTFAEAVGTGPMRGSGLMILVSGCLLLLSSGFVRKRNGYG